MFQSLLVLVPKLIAPLESVIDPFAVVRVPTVIVPVVVKFSLPKLIAPEICDRSIGKCQVTHVEPVPPLRVPVVVKFSFPKLMAPDESVIDPSSSKMLPAARHGPD